MRSDNEPNTQLDVLGTVTSLACAVHCALLPLAASSLPLLGLGWLADERAEWLLLTSSLALGLVSLWPSYQKHHRQLRPLCLLGSGALLLLSARLLLGEESPLEVPFVVCGALFLSGAHLLNRYLCRSCPAC